MTPSSYICLPQVGIGDTKSPLLFAIYPGHSLMWEDVSIAFASQGYAVVALSPSGGLWPRCD